MFIFVAWISVEKIKNKKTLFYFKYNEIEI